MIGAYIPPSESDNQTIKKIEEEMKGTTLPLIICGDYNINKNTNDGRSMDILDSMSNLGVSDITKLFKKPKKFWHGCTWRRNYKNLKSTYDYFFSSDLNNWKNVQYIEPRYFSTDHILLMGVLSIRTKTYHKRYIRRREKLPMTMDKGIMSSLYERYEELIKWVPKIQKRGPESKKYWITRKTWRILDKKAALRNDSIMEKKRRKNK